MSATLNATPSAPSAPRAQAHRAAGKGMGKASAAAAKTGAEAAQTPFEALLALGADADAATPLMADAEAGVASLATQVIGKNTKNSVEADPAKEKTDTQDSTQDPVLLGIAAMVVGVPSVANPAQAATEVSAVPAPASSGAVAAAAGEAQALPSAKSNIKSVAPPPDPRILHWQVNELLHPLNSAFRQNLDRAVAKRQDLPPASTFERAGLKAATSAPAVAEAQTETAAAAPPESFADTTQDRSSSKDAPRGLESLLASAKPAPLAAPAAVASSAPADATSLIQQIHHLTEAMAQRVDGTVKMSGRNVEASIRLSPPDLGNLSVTLHVQNDSTMQARIVADRPETAQLIQQHVNQLQEGLTRQGLTVERIQIDVASGSSNARFGNDHASSDLPGRNEQRQQAMNDAQQRRQDARRNDQAYRSFDGALA